MKVRITRRRIILLVSILLFILLVITIYPQIKLPVYSINYLGTKLSFRVNLRDVQNIPIYPSEEAVQNEIMNQLVENITIIFKPGEGEINAHYAVEVFEIVSKLAIAYKKKFGYMPGFNAVNVTSYENLKGTKENPVIVLIHPIYSNETLVKLENHVIFLQGKNATSSEEQLKNFDLAVVKFIVVALGIKV